MLNIKQARSLMASSIFHILSLPLGIIYFTITIVGISLSLGTLVIWLGIPLLCLLFIIIHGMAAVERRLARQLLGAYFAEQELPITDAPPLSFWKRFSVLLRDPLSWTSLLYMILKLPLGIISFVLTITFTTLSIFITLLPIVYMVNVFIHMILIQCGIQPVSYLLPLFLEVHGGFDPIMFMRSFIGIPLGLLISTITYLLLQGLASFSATLIYALLSPTAQHTSMPHPMPMEGMRHQHYDLA